VARRRLHDRADVRREVAPLADLDGAEVWALNALHGIRIVTRWVDGPGVAEQPGRLAAWRARLDALRRPLPVSPASCSTVVASCSMAA